MILRILIITVMYYQRGCNVICPDISKYLRGKKHEVSGYFTSWTMNETDFSMNLDWDEDEDLNLNVVNYTFCFRKKSRSFLVEILLNPNFAGVDIVVLSYDIWYMYINAMYLNMVVADSLMIHQPIKSSPASCCASWDILCCCFSCSKEAWRQHPAGWLS